MTATTAAPVMISASDTSIWPLLSSAGFDTCIMSLYGTGTGTGTGTGAGSHPSHLLCDQLNLGARYLADQITCLRSRRLVSVSKGIDRS